MRRTFSLTPPRSRLFASLCLVVLLTMPVAVAAQSAGPPRALPAVIPVFPLQDATLFPNGSYGFYIFEPRYRAMVADALKGDRIIGMVMLQPGHEAEYEGRPPIFPIGCAGVITAYEELPGGEYNIILQGLTKFRVAGEDSSRPYRLARVAAVPEILDADEAGSLAKDRQRISGLLMALGADVPPADVPDVQVVDQLAQHLPIAPLDRQRLLERDDALARASRVLEVLAQILNAP
jgi:Lon protease-like protein